MFFVLRNHYNEMMLKNIITTGNIGGSYYPIFTQNTSGKRVWFGSQWNNGIF
jgi:hypothetical protein